MTRDYAKKATQGPGAKKKGKRPVPPWLWMLTGLLIGLFVAFLVYINRVPAPSETASSVSAPAPKASRSQPAPQKRAAPAPAHRDDDRVRFDFYRILPEYEVVIPEEELSKPQSAAVPPGDYLVQAGSFRSAADADTRKAELALLGLVSRVQKVTVDGRDSWHRVQMGPYTDTAELDRVRRMLQDNGIDFIVLRERQ